MKTLGDFITAARTLLQDTLTADPRYSDSDFKLALQLAFDEAYRLRPDLLHKVEAPNIMAMPDGDDVPVPRGYQSAFLYYMCGQVQLRDQEDTQDNRASIFLNKFIAQLLTTAA